MKLDALSKQLGHTFRHPGLLQRALTHCSHSVTHNERLEFLGDSVLNCVIAKYLYDTHTDLAEGVLSRQRSNLVNQQTLVTLPKTQLLYCKLYCMRLIVQKHKHLY